MLRASTDVARAECRRGFPAVPLVVSYPTIDEIRVAATRSIPEAVAVVLRPGEL
jgi:hypothetical protein